MKQPLNAVVAGHLCIDIFPNLENFPKGKFLNAFKPGRLLQVGGAQFSTGGPVSNTGLALQHLGIPVNLIAKIGNDPFGKITYDLIKKHGSKLTDGIKVDRDSITSYSVIISPPGVDRIFLHCPGANDTFSSGDISKDLIKNAALFHFGYPPLMRKMFINNGAELKKIMRLAKSFNMTTSLDMSYPDPSSESGKADWQSILFSTLPFVDIFLPSLEEILYFLRRETYEELSAKGDILKQATPDLIHDIGQELIDYGVKIVVIKMGERGLYLRTGDQSKLEKCGLARPENWRKWANREMWVPCFKVELVGTTGAGDATIAGFLSGFLRGMLPEQAISMAVAVGACNVEAADALSGLKTWEETIERIEKGWARLISKVMISEAVDSGWLFDSENQLWFGPFDDKN